MDTEWVFADGSYEAAHSHASGARRGEERAIGKYYVVALLKKSIFVPMRIETRAILKSLGVKSTILKLQIN